MAEVKTSDDAVYVILHNGLNRLVDNLNKFCKGEYGRSCDIYRAYIRRKDPSNYPATEFEGVGAELIAQVRDQLESDREHIRFETTVGDRSFDLEIVPGSEQDYLGEHIDEADLAGLADTDTVVLVRDAGDMAELEQFFSTL